MKRNALVPLAVVFAVLALCAIRPAETPAAATKVTCDTCPVASVQPKASHAFTTADTSHGCATRTSNGLPIPDPKCTPGAVNPTVTLQVLQNTAFRTECVRDCSTTETDKSATYSLYGIPHPAKNEGKTQTCELDHLVPLELGGADTLDNIWPQCGPSGVALAQRYFKQKDMVENFLADQVKSGQMELEKTQAAIALDWTPFLSDATQFCLKNPTKCKVAD